LSRCIDVEDGDLKNDVMKITLRLFSSARDLAGYGESTLQLPPGARTGDVLTSLEHGNPKFIEWRHAIRLAVNYEYVSDDHLLHDGDEVAVIPPVSGG
jgi:sulfur-carrier protein